MSRNLIGVDHANKAWLIGCESKIKRLIRRVNPCQVAYELTGLVMLIATIAILFAASSVASSKEPMCYAEAHEHAEWLISDEMAEYIEQHPGTYAEEDLQ